MDKGKYLDSWKEISAYLGRNLRTCRNWEQDFGLPVHRLDGAAKSHVFAYTGEIDAWREKKGRLPETVETGIGETGAPNRPSALDKASNVRTGGTRRVAVLGAMIFLAVATTAFVTWRLRPMPRSAVGRFTMKLEPGLWLEGGRDAPGLERDALELERPSRTAMAISSDGRFLVYSAIEGNPAPEAKPQLYVRRMDQSEATPITGTEGGIHPFLSPDNRWVGFWADRKLKKIPINGGVATELCDSPDILGADWGRNDSIVFAPQGDGPGILKIPAAGGKPEALTEPDPKRGELSHRLPSWLPDGKALLITVMKHIVDSRPRVVLFRLDTRQRRVLLEDAANARYVPAGYIVFMRQGTLMAVRFDPDTMEALGQPVAIEKGVMQSFSLSYFTNIGAGQFAVSNTGSLIYASGGTIPPLQNALVWLDQRGTERSVSDLRYPFYAPRLSPEGRRVAYDVYQPEGRIWVYDLDRGTNSQLTDEGQGEYPIWSPDGKRVLFGCRKSLVSNLYLRTCDESLPAERLTECDVDQFAGSWASDGHTVAILEWSLDRGAGIAMLDVRSGGVTPFLDSESNELYPEFSPDGHWLAYSSDVSNRMEVYVQAYPGPGVKQPISNGGGIQPLWSKDGKRLFYRWQDQVWVVDMRTDDGFACSKPHLLFERPGYLVSSPIRNYDLSLDGRQFLMVKLEQRKPEPVTELTVIENWFEEIKRLAPAGKK